MIGHITGREVQVITDLLEEKKVPRATWSMTPRGTLTILVGDRAVSITCPRKQTYYGLKALVEKVSKICDENAIKKVPRT